MGRTRACHQGPQPDPVFLVGRILTPQLGEKLLRSGACDLVADPVLLSKSASGRRIRPCVGIQSGCWQRVSVGRDIPYAFNPTAGRAARAGTTFVSSVRVTAVDREAIYLTDLLSGAVEPHTGYDALVVALVPEADDELFAHVKAAGFAATLVGDALAPRSVTDATHEGHAAARALGSLDRVAPTATVIPA